ncbi:MAG: histidine kinase [Bradyrhizobiaceae bacterium]|nr:MAG: histidine kinase [Bradyrhizobiaceae bacterium]
MEDATSRHGPFRRSGYFAKFVISFVGLVVLVLLVNGSLETWFMYRETTQLVIKSETEKAEATARRVEQLVTETERQISWVTRASATTVEQRHADYQLLLQQVPALNRTIHLDNDGREQVRLTRQEQVVGSGLDYSGDPRFRESRGRLVWWSPVYFNGREPFIAVVVAHSGQNGGSTIAEINLRILSSFIERGQTGSDTDAFIVDHLGRLLAHTSPEQSLGANYADLPQVGAMLGGSAVPVTIGRTRQGQSVLVGAAAVPLLKWHVFFEQSLSTALRPVHSLIYRTVWLLLLGVIVAVLAGMLLARRLVAPINTLQAGARQLEASNFGHRITVKTGDEMEQLAEQFNRMADELQSSYGRLEQKVEERTRDLARSNSELKALEEIGRAVASSLDINAVLATIVARATVLSHADAGAIYTYDAARASFVLAEARGIDQPLLKVARDAPVDFEGQLLGVSATERKAISIPDLSKAKVLPHQAAILASGFQSMLLVPLARQDELLGALVLLRRATGDFPASDILQTFADQSVLALNNANLFREVEQTGRQLAVASEHKSQFLANMSHELRTPLNAVLGYAELLADGLYGEIPAKAAEVLERIQHNGRHLLGLINDVLDISKIEAGQLSLSLDDYSVENMVQSVVSATGSLASAKNIEIRTEIQDDLPIGRGDERRLTQVLLNLVSNAIKFTDVGSVTIRVRVVDDAFSIAVEDTGPGIAPEDQAKVFEEFQQVDSSSTRAKGGTGLGLAISRRLIALHGGRIDLQSTLGVGSTFGMIVPVRVDQQSQPA